MFHIFTGIEILFFSLGILVTLSVQAVIYLRVIKQVKFIHLAIIFAGLLTMIFAFAWSVSSILELEPQSASVGMLVIGMPGLIMAVLGGRLAYPEIRRNQR
ncbi:hypothetical protein [Vibrio sp. SCSIO 43137]|uniref:hypothetical protein n=1 Tax=Vibrio sp. SCSIO 43137 TaxID=3021011 RepID=UPI002306F2A9|nr:hypothetical protein [Vibrio sp. SCSIO 43137]WCE30559.1 hypothetical protein PK654_04600 [Vibrio sp. SCSIO 43137]